ENKIGDNLSDVKTKNRSLVLRLIKKKGFLSRIELARITGLTQPTITNIVNDLIKAGLLIEVGTSETKAGRKPILLAFNDQAFYVVAISFKKKGFTVALTDLGPNILYRRDSNYSLLENTEMTLVELQKEFIHVLEYATQSLSLILGIGVSVPGPADPESFTILAHPVFLAHHNLDLRPVLREYDLPIFMMNNAYAACLHETWGGKAKEARSLVYFMVGETVGAGIMVDGKLYQGTDQKAGEIGRTSINIFGPRCVCGNYGCTELYCSTKSAVEKALEAAWLGKSPFLKKRLREKENTLTFQDLLEGAKNKDPVCREIFTSLGQYVGIGVVNLLNLYNPEVLVIGGEIALAKEFIESSVQQVIEERLLYRDYTSSKIYYSQWGEDVTLLGAASLVLDRFIAGELGRF
ncbi:MAG TPA: ROK family transcriptional regulator, partial [Candidatus Atribacteria bacterium]|nr:ROK family transcriptional regulator [Candidatus Atribacteria bacterium]